MGLVAGARAQPLQRTCVRPARATPVPGSPTLRPSFQQFPAVQPNRAFILAQSDGAVKLEHVHRRAGQVQAQRFAVFRGQPISGSAQTFAKREHGGAEQLPLRG
jgi:hypothetical protein